MRAFRDMPIAAKLRLMLMATSASAILLASFLVIAFVIQGSWRDMTRGLYTLAEVLGENSKAALAFEDRSDAEGVLSALAAKTTIRDATLYLADGEPLAAYPADVAPQPLDPD
ncbi:MAG: hypothetical protein K8I02_10425, partial [Candidatus Methylomirabilis sp.]|nr:hypothetical protein [Deltaproteobacteria bacterium]